MRYRVLFTLQILFEKLFRVTTFIIRVLNFLSYHYSSSFRLYYYFLMSITLKLLLFLFGAEVIDTIILIIVFVSQLLLVLP